MRRLELDGEAGRLRARRWDVVVLGSGLPGLVAAVRLGMAGARVLVVEEEAAGRIPPLCLEPFYVAGSRPDGVLQSCLTALGVAPIERRGVERSELAYQVVFPEARIDVGLAPRTQEEWVAWGLAKPELARDAVRGLESAAHAEAEALLEATLVRRGVRRPSPRAAPSAGSGRHLRGLPVALSRPEPALARFLEVQVRALANLATSLPSPEARARLLGAPLEGGVSFGPGRGVRALVRRRLEQVHGEVRAVVPPFELAEIDGHPGVVMRRARDAWLGRALVLNAPQGRLASALEAMGSEVPELLRRPLPTHRRAAIHLRAAREVLPEAMADRLIVAGVEPGERPVCVARHAGAPGARLVELTASTVVPDGADLASVHDRLERALRALLPFSDRRVGRVAEAARPAWDDDLALGDPREGSGWPTEVEIRASTGALVFALSRDELGGLGAEGDLLLGWQAGDTIAAALPRPALG